MKTSRTTGSGSSPEDGEAFVRSGPDLVDAKIEYATRAPAPSSVPHAIQLEWTPFSVGLVVNMALVVAFNAVPLWGVVARGWSVFAIILLYWAEGLVIGAVNVLKLRLIARHQDVGQISAGFFAFHYGGASLVLGLFLFIFFGNPDVPWTEVGLGLLALLASHAVSFVFGFVLPGEATRADPGLQMIAPYSRIAVVQVTVFLGASLIESTGSQLAGLQVLVALKIVIELLALFFRVQPPAPAQRDRGHARG